MIRTLLFRMIAAMALATLAVGFIAMRPVSAAELKRSVVVSTDLVLLGDLFDGAGPLASKPVFRSPELGVSGALPVADALAAASAAGLALDTPPTSPASRSSAVPSMSPPTRCGPWSPRPPLPGSASPATTSW